MADPRPTSDDPLIISGIIPRALEDAPSTINFGDPWRPDRNYCCYCGGPACCCFGSPGCDIFPPFGCCCCEPMDLFPKDPGQGDGGGCVFDSPASFHSLVLDNAGPQNIANACDAPQTLTFTTVSHRRGFCLTLNPCCVYCEVEIPKTGLWHVDSKAIFDCVGVTASYQLSLLLNGSLCTRQSANIQITGGTCGGLNLSTTRTYTAGDLLKIQANFSGLNCPENISDARFSLFLVGESCD